MGELGAGFANLETEGIEKRIDICLAGDTDGPAEWDRFAFAIFGEDGRVIARIEGEKQNAKLARIGRRRSQRFLELSNVLDAGAAASGVDRENDHGVTRELGQVMR